MYGYLMGDIPDLKEMIRELNSNKCQIIDTFYCSDTNQVVIIYDEPEEKQSIGFLRPIGE